ncbi:hypothetical protein NX801_28235 [Streptomyces sp. LP05-1]|uniref:Uncharacterized protein n=1 Tax=Streptomyces pyxinae TaxID=2970734 RepID=A0ABT2CPU0_9ACTN|nr:hypothetical protein [Streptomyces sp. LP05-1]MCS0639453.1 hypothetical protein [Streptomyces sp. LP05-1]
MMTLVLLVLPLVAAVLLLQIPQANAKHRSASLKLPSLRPPEGRHARE